MHSADIRSALDEVARMRDRLLELEDKLAELRGRNAELNHRLDVLHVSHDRLDLLEKALAEEADLSSRLKEAFDWLICTSTGAEELPGWDEVVEPALDKWGELRDGVF